MTPPTALAILLAALGAEPTEAAKPGLPPVAVLLTLEVEDLERDIGHQGEAVTTSRQRLAAAQKLGARGSASQDELEQEAADARYQEARLVEMKAVRDLKALQRDILSGTVAGDEEKEYGLVRAVLKSQEATAQVEADFRAYRQRQARLLLQRKAVSREFKANADVDAESALSAVTQMHVRQARLAREFALRPGAGPADSQETKRREIAFLRATLDHARQLAALAHARAAVVRDRVRVQGTSAVEIDGLRQAADAADARVAADAEALARAEAPPPTPSPAPTP